MEPSRLRMVATLNSVKADGSHMTSVSTKTFTYTNFSNAKKYVGDRYSIALYNPPTLNGFGELPLFYPTQAMLHTKKAGEMTEEEYTRQYLELLAQRRPKIANVLPVIASGSVLCCWCAPGEFCHRRILAAWLEDNFSIEASID
jgi:hypothetical protein